MASQDLLSGLPTHVLLEIITVCDAKSVGKLRAVNRYTQKVIDTFQKSIAVKVLRREDPLINEAIDWVDPARKFFRGLNALNFAIRSTTGAEMAAHFRAWRITGWPLVRPPLSNDAATRLVKRMMVACHVAWDLCNIYTSVKQALNRKRNLRTTTSANGLYSTVTNAQLEYIRRAPKLVIVFFRFYYVFRNPCIKGWYFWPTIGERIFFYPEYRKVNSPFISGNREIDKVQEWAAWSALNKDNPQAIGNYYVQVEAVYTDRKYFGTPLPPLAESLRAMAFLRDSTSEHERELQTDSVRRVLEEIDKKALTRNIGIRKMLQEARSISDDWAVSSKWRMPMFGLDCLALGTPSTSQV